MTEVKPQYNQKVRNQKVRNQKIIQFLINNNFDYTLD